jgi:hypothetical protein
MKYENMKLVFTSDLQQFKRQFGKIYKCDLMAKIGREKISQQCSKSYLVKRDMHIWSVMYKF